MPEIDPQTEAEKDIPRFVRRCWEQFQEATVDQRKASVESLKMWVGGENQWRPGEIASRTGNNRPWITINCCKTAVDQVENEARENPPGPQAHPVGGIADKDGADILEGLIREYEYRSNAAVAYVTSVRYAAAGNAGVFELATEYESERSMAQRLAVKEAEDPAMYFCDPYARRVCREDAMWGGKIRQLSREQLIQDYGPKLKVLNRNMLERGTGWMQDAFGWRGDQATTNEWTGGASSRNGPYYVCEFYWVKISREKLTLYSDSILRFKGETVPAGVTPKKDAEGKEISRSEPRRRVVKYVVTALDVLSGTDWPGTMPPFFWVMGPEIYISGKLYRLSLIDGAKDAQRGLNYAATSAAEVVASMTKSPWVGWVGQFDVANAQGFNPWEASNTQMLSYMEVKPAFAINPTTKAAELLPPPQRNTWEAPIARVLELCTFFREQIKSATSVFFDPSVQAARDAQSGEAIKALQSQTNIGTVNWQDQLHRAVALSYQQAAIILPKIMDGPRVRTVVRADSKHEQIAINQEFPGDPTRGIPAGMDPKSGKKNDKGEMEYSKGKTNSILGQYSLRVTAAPKDEQTRNDDAIDKVNEVVHAAPQILNAPGFAAQLMRLIGQGNPVIEQMADSLEGGDPSSPEQMQQQNTQLKQQNQQLMTVAQKLHQIIQSKQPEIDAKKYIAELQALTTLKAAEIKAGVDTAQLDEQQLEHLTGLAHEAATQAADHEHETRQLAAGQQADAQAQASDQAADADAQASDQAHASEAQASDQQHASESQASDQAAAAEAAAKAPKAA
jgi:hypothetical protein